MALPPGIKYRLSLDACRNFLGGDADGWMRWPEMAGLGREAKLDLFSRLGQGAARIVEGVDEDGLAAGVHDEPHNGAQELYRFDFAGQYIVICARGAQGYGLGPQGEG
jgi:hypothetical protein